MGIRTKFNPMGGAGGKKYKAYFLYLSSSAVQMVEDIKNLGFSETVTEDNCYAVNTGLSDYDTNYFILNNALYKFDSGNNNFEYINNTRGEWADAKSQGVTLTGILDSKIVNVRSSGIQVINQSRTWKKISGIRSTTGGFVFAIDDTNAVYSIDINKTATAVSNVYGTALQVNGTVHNNTFATVIGNNNVLFCITGNSSTIGNISSLSQKAISIVGKGVHNSNSEQYVMLGISDTGKPFTVYMNAQVVVKVSTPVSVTNPLVKITNGLQYSLYPNSYAMDNNGAIFRITASSVSNISLSKITSLNDNWTDITGNGLLGLGINNNNLYSIFGTTVAAVTGVSGKCIKLSGSNPFLAIFEE